MNKAIKRIINKDLKSIEHYKLNEHGIFIEFNEENMLEAHAMIIGPKDTLYEGGYLFFNINFPKNYPYSPPDVSYVSRGRVRIHPNLYVGGHKSGLGKVIEQVPLSELILETDAPYLAPTPKRGKRNESAYLLQIAEQQHL